MAQVDLSGADAERLRQQYQTSLGRAASDDEVSGWLSGSFGGGGTEDYLRQIQGSHEAQQRNPPTSYTPPVVGTNPDNYTTQTPTSYTPGGMDAGFSQSLGSAYQDYLGRQASPDELMNWWSGQFGYGSGLSGLGSFREAIRNSGEAKQRNSGVAPNPSYQDTMHWNTQGVPDTDIFDTATGQLKPGWSRTKKGYERTGGAGTTTGSGDLQSYVRSLLSGASSPQALAAIESQLNQRGIKLQKDSAGNVRGRLYLPDGSTVDVVSQWGAPWTWTDRSGGGGTGGVGGGGLPGDQYSDPYSRLLEQLLKSRIGNLQGGYDDGMRQQYQNALQQRANALGQGNTQLDQLMGYLQERYTDLKGPGYTGAENEVLRTQALDPLETDRNAARQRVMQRLSERGLTPDSGIAQQALLEVDKAFDAMRGTTQTQLAGNELARREDRSQRAEMIGGQIADIPDMRAREQLDVFSALEQLSLLARNEDEARSREAISYGGVLSDMGPQRLSLAMQAAGMGGNPQGLSNTLMGIAGLNQNASAMNQQNSNSLWSGLGTIAAIIARQQQSGLSRAGI